MSRIKKQKPTFLDPSALPSKLILQGIQADYVIGRKLGSGLRGNTYVAKVIKLHCPSEWAFEKVKNGQKVVIKTVNLNADWPLVETVEYISRVNRSLQKELFVLAKLKGVNCAARVYDHHLFTSMLEGFPFHPMFIVQGFVPGDTLDKFVNKKWGPAFSGIPDAGQWFRYASLIAANLIHVHQQEIVHRDIWPPNIMVSEANNNRRDSIHLSFIDFGDAVLRHEYAAREFVGHEHPYKAPERSNDWLWPTRRGDIYAVGGVLHFLATGNEPPLPIDNKDELKHTVLENIRAKNPGLLKQNVGIVDVIARCLRYDPIERIRDADDLLHEIEVFQAVDRDRKDGWGKEMRLALKKIQKHVQRFTKTTNGHADVFSAMAEQDMRLLEHRLESMTHGVRDISGDHETIAAGLTSYLSVLGPGDEYLAVTIPDFWSAENLGINGRFLTMNRLIAERGVKIRRLFLVTQEEWDAKPTGSFWQIANAHLEIQKPLSKDLFDLRYLLVTDDLRTEYRKNDLHKGVWISGASAVTILPVYGRRNPIIRTVRMRKYEGKAATIRRDLNRLIDRGSVLTR